MYGVHITLRMRLMCQIHRCDGQKGEEIEVLNEVVVDRGANPYLTKIECWEHDRLITKVSSQTQPPIHIVVHVNLSAEARQGHYQAVGLALCPDCQQTAVSKRDCAIWIICPLFVLCMLEIIVECYAYAKRICSLHEKPSVLTQSGAIRHWFCQGSA